MSLTSACPLPTALTSVPETACPIIFDQITKIAFQQIQPTSSFTKTTIALNATWTPFLAAIDDTKIVLSPSVSNIVIPASEVASEGGGDNTTINGIRNVKGLNSVTITGAIQNISDATKLALQGLFPFTKAPMAGSTLLWAYFITNDGRVIGKMNGATNIEGFAVYNLTVSDPLLEGYRKDNVFNLSFDMEGGWSDHFEVVATDFKPLTFKNPS